VAAFLAVDDRGQDAAVCGEVAAEAVAVGVGREVALAVVLVGRPDEGIAGVNRSTVTSP
jgi:hypothetical protein